MTLKLYNAADDILCEVETKPEDWYVPEMFVVANSKCWHLELEGKGKLSHAIIGQVRFDMSKHEMDATGTLNVPPGYFSVALGRSA